MRDFDIYNPPGAQDDYHLALKQQGAQAWERMLREAQTELADLSQRLDTALETGD